MSPYPASSTNFRIASYILMGVFLFLVLRFRLLVPLLSGLLVFELVCLIASKTHLNHLTTLPARYIALFLISGAIILLIMLLCGILYQISRGEISILPSLITQTSSASIAFRDALPGWLGHYLPNDINQWKATLAEWINRHMADLQSFGARTGHVFGQSMIAMIVGGLLSLKMSEPLLGPLSKVLLKRILHFSRAFHYVVFAQVRISALNTFFTFCYLIIVLPLLGPSLPLTTTLVTLVVLTFVTGLLPVIGNLISNTAIVLVSLSISPVLAISSLVFLVVIHKLEYFLNARIIGVRISAHAWEILLAMLLMEAIFGISGLIAAPVFYAYLKEELTEVNLI